jgi:hypothetical protein
MLIMGDRIWQAVVPVQTVFLERANEAELST